MTVHAGSGPLFLVAGGSTGHSTCQNPPRFSCRKGRQGARMALCLTAGTALTALAYLHGLLRVHVPHTKRSSQLLSPRSLSDLQCCACTCSGRQSLCGARGRPPGAVHARFRVHVLTVHHTRPGSQQTWTGQGQAPPVLAKVDSSHLSCVLAGLSMHECMNALQCWQRMEHSQRGPLVLEQFTVSAWGTCLCRTPPMQRSSSSCATGCERGPATCKESSYVAVIMSNRGCFSCLGACLDLLHLTHVQLAR